MRQLRISMIVIGYKAQKKEFNVNDSEYYDKNKINKFLMK
jgi:hypothetical protein